MIRRRGNRALGKTVVWRIATVDDGDAKPAAAGGTQAFAFGGFQPRLRSRRFIFVCWNVGFHFQETSASLQHLSSMAIGQEPEVTDSDEAFRQNMLQETPEESLGG